MITAKEARELAIGNESKPLKELLAKCEETIKREAELGFMNCELYVAPYTVAVISQVGKLLSEKGFSAKVKNASLKIMW